MENDSAKASWLSLKLADQTLPERWGHSGVYHDSKLYIYGGCCGGVQFSDLLMLDLEAMSWKKLVTSGQEPGPRDSHTAVLHGRKMIVFGGTSGSKKTNEVHVLDLESLVWTRPTIQGSAPAPRESHTMTMVNKNQALVFAGSGDGGKYLDDVYLLDCESMEWIAPMMKGYSPVCRDSHTSVVIEKKLFLYGGDCGDRYLGDVDVLDLESFTWSKLENAGSTTQPGVRAGHTAVAVGTKMYTFGGVGDRTYYNDAWIMDVETRIWSRLEVAGVHPQGRFSHVAALVDGGMVVYGGCGEDEKPLEELLVLNLRGKKMPESGIWSKIGTDYRIDIVQRKTSSQVSSRADNLKTSRFLRKLDRHCASKPAQKKRKSPNSSAVRESDALSLAESKISPRRPVPRYPTLRCSRNSDRSLTETNGIQIGCEVYGVVDGVLDSGYLMTAHLNGQVLRGFLFNPDHESKETVATRPENSSRAVPIFPVFPANAAASIAVEEESTASKDTDNDNNVDRIMDLKQMPSPTRDEEQVTLSLFSN